MKFVTRPLKSADDLNDIAGETGYLFVRDGIGFAGQGVAIESDADSITNVLANCEIDNRVGGPGTGPVAFGALAFDEHRATRFIVPRVIVGKREDGTSFSTTIEGDPTHITSENQPAKVAREYTMRSGSVSPSRFKDVVLRTTEHIKTGEMRKAVIARDIVIEASAPMSVHEILLRLKSSYGSSYRYSFDGLIGASPELLVEVLDGVVRSRPLAGTAPRTGNDEEDDRLATELLRSAKNQSEHRIVIDVVRDTLLPHCSYLDWEPEPSLLKVANVQHLGSEAEGVLTKPFASVLQLARELCPTPALGGHPRHLALDWIREVEGLERGRYGGAVGWLDALGNGTWAVTIRCAEMSSDRRSAHLFAGCGIVADSDPESELAETQTKFQAMINAITLS